MRANLDVMTDLHKIVELDPVGNQRVVQGAPVNTGVSTNFDVIADAYRAQLLDLFPTTTVRRKTEPISAYHNAGMKQAALANMTVFRHCHTRTQLSVSADGSAALNDTQGSHDRAGMHPSLRVNHRTGMDSVAQRSLRGRLPEPGHTGKIEVGLRYQDT